MAAPQFPSEQSRGQFPNAHRDEQEYIKFLCGAQLSDLASGMTKGPLSAEVAKARQKINESLANSSAASGDAGRIAKLEAANQSLEQTVKCLTSRIAELEKKFASLSTGAAAPAAAVAAKAPPARNAAAANNDADGDDDDDDVDLFGSDEDDAEAERIKQERLKAYQEKKSKKPALIAKSNIILDVKPWDDETDMVELERLVRTIQTDGLLWGSSKFVPLAYGIKKLQISCVVEDDKVGTDFLEEEITKFENHVQSVDVAAFQKI